jgi:sentrin-specific protease 7
MTYRFLETTLVDAQKRKFYVFKCFFFTKLCDVSRKHIVNGNDRFKIAFEAVKKWTRGVSIFEKDYIFIPINERCMKFY